MNNQSLKQQILSRKAVLENAAAQLKTEFVGLDNIIDEVMNLISPWYLFPEAQMRPTVINLWGMTGTGKTALVHRLVELLSFERSYLHFDMGEFGSKAEYGLKSILYEDLTHFHEKEVILCLDEFQFAKSLNENGGEIEQDKLRIIWDLLDSGKFFYNGLPSQHYIKMGYRAYELLNQCILAGVEIDNGKVVQNVEAFQEIFKGFTFSYWEKAKGKVKPNLLVSDNFTGGLFALTSDRFSTRYDLTQAIRGMRIEELAGFVLESIFQEGSLKLMDLSRSLVFVVGNLDEAFYMSKNINPDISADEFYRDTLKIKIGHIKRALQKRFRNEQIARLGNNHLIYPAFTSEGYRKLIDMQLKRINGFVEKKFGLTFEFSEAVKRLIYEEGVFPTQGARPLLTTISNQIESNVSRVVCEILEKDVAVKSLVWDYAEENYLFKYVDEWDRKHDFAQYPVKLRVNLLRKSKNDDRQAYTAVHEAGHAVLAALTTRILPEKVVTRTADSTSHGFCQIRMPRDMMTKELLRKEIIISLGGYAAERLVFGEEETSTGVSGDIEDATELAIEAVKYYAMGKDPIHIRVAANDYNESFFHKPKYEKAALQLIREGLQSAEELLVRNKLLMLKMAAYLTEHARMDKATIGDFVKKYSVEPWVQTEPFIEPKEYFRFKDRVLQQLEEMEQEENEGN